MSKNIEYEGKILNIDITDVHKRLAIAGAIKKADYNFKRYIFDTIPKIDKRWVRLRSDGQSATLTVKEIVSNSIDGTHEWETGVSDLESTLIILDKIGILPRTYQENTREDYSLDNATISIDCWPKLQPYIEIEADSVQEVTDIATKLGFDKNSIVADNTKKLYKDLGIDIENLSELKF